MKLKAPEDCAGASFNGVQVELDENGCVDVSYNPDMVKALKDHGFTEVKEEPKPAAPAKEEKKDPAPAKSEKKDQEKKTETPAAPTRRRVADDDDGSDKPTKVS
jgi:hypothetical protein